MINQHKALQPVGRFKVGETVGGLSDTQIKQLLADKIIEEVKPSAPTKLTKEVKRDGE
mgnify:CR=1 FL=1